MAAEERHVWKAVLNIHYSVEAVHDVSGHLSKINASL